MNANANIFHLIQILNIYFLINNHDIYGNYNMKVKYMIRDSFDLLDIFEPK
jgi:hypothetical protein